MDEIRLMEPEELLAWDQLYRTVLDCYKVSIGEWRHFRDMRWHDQSNSELILETARKQLTEWLDSDDFVDYCRYFGFHPWHARRGAMDVLLGKFDQQQVKEMLDDIGRQRDNRRKREEGATNGTRRRERSIHLERITRACGGVRGICTSTGTSG